MGFLDDAKKKLSDAVDDHGDKIAKATGAAKDGLDKLDHKNDDIK